MNNILAACLLTAPSISLAAIVGFNADISNQTGSTADDFHVEVVLSGGASNALAGDRFYNGPNNPFGPPTANNFGSATNIVLDWKSASAIQPCRTPPCPKIHIGWEFDDGGNKNSVRYAVDGTFWTIQGNRVPGSQPTLPGFTATGIGQNSLFTLHNDTNGQLTIQNLAFMLNDGQTELDAMIPFALPGFTSPIPDFVMDAGMSMDFDPGSMLPGGFLLAELSAFPTADPGNVSTVMFQHGVPIPETPTLLLLSLGLIGLTGFRYRRRKGSAR